MTILLIAMETEAEQIEYILLCKMYPWAENI